MDLNVNDRVDIISGTVYVGKSGYITSIEYNTPYAPLQNLYIIKFDNISGTLYSIREELSINREWYREQQLKKIGL